MKKRNSPDTDPAVLRLKAEELLKGKPIITTAHLSKADALKLIHELEVYQSKLEMQNKELELAKQQADKVAADKYNELFDFAPLGFFTLERSGEIIELNLSAAKLLGNERSQVKNSNFGTFVPDEAKPIFDLFLRNIFSKINQQPCELLLAIDDNAPTYVLLTGNLIDNGKHCLLTVVDITQRKLAEQALRERNSRLELVMQSADMAWWEMDLPSGNIAFGNRKAEMLGFPPEKFSHYRDFTALVHPDDRNKAMNAMQLHFDGTLDKYDVEYQILTSTGEYKWFHDIGSVVKRDAKGNPLKVTGLVFNITEHRQNEATLENERLLLRTLIDNIPDSIYSKDIACRKTLANLTEVRYMGANSETDVLGKNDFDIYPKEMAEKFYADDQLVLQTGKPVINREEFIFDENGEKRWLLSSKLPLRDKNGNIIGLAGIGRDITGIKQAQIAMHESDELYRNLVDKLPDGVYKSTHEGKFVDVNNAMVSMLGYTNKEELLAIDITTQLYFEPSDRESVELKEKLEKTGVYRMKKKDGSEIWVEDHGWLNFDENQKILFHEGIMRDVTESKRAELALQESEALYRNLVERLPDGVYKSTHEGKFVEVNPAMVQMLGYASKEELLDIDIKTELYFLQSDRESLVLQEKLEEMGIYRLKKKDGSAIWVEDHGWYIPDENGNILFHEGIMRNITDRKEAEKALEYEHYLLNALMNNVPSHIYFKDLQSRFIRINDAHARVFGLKNASEVVGKTDFDFFTEEHAKTAYDDEQEIIRTGKPIVKEEKETWSDQPDTWVSTTKMPLFDKDGTIAGTFGISVDITERKKSEDELQLKNEELQKLNIQKDKFFSIIAHDLRGPFSGFLDLTEMMAGGISGMTTEEIQRIASVMKNSATNIYHLIGNLLEWSMMQRGITSFNPVSFLLLPKIQESIALPLEAATIKAIVVGYDIAEELQVYADVNMLGGILRNLVTNAVKFTPKGGSILVSAKQTADHQIQISVKDTGIGMSNQMIENLFQLDINTSRKGTEGESSSGLGLIICKDFVEKQNGLLWVESQEGKGTTFHFTLPADSVVKEIKPAANITHAEETVNPDKKLKILIAENDETSEMLISITVKPLSREIITVQNGVEAVETCRNNPDIDLVLMDIQMPEMDGYEATRLIRQFNKKVIIIAQTAYGLAGESDKALEAGCNDYIMKPLNLALLKRLIRKHLYE